MNKPEAILDAIRQADVGDDVIIHNDDGSVYCIINILTKEHPESGKLEPLEKVRVCGTCGGKTIFIRGKYPGMEKRKVCATCAIERLEQIREISDKDYGLSSQSI